MSLGVIGAGNIEYVCGVRGQLMLTSACWVSRYSISSLGNKCLDMLGKVSAMLTLSRSDEGKINSIPLKSVAALIEFFSSRI